MSSFIGKMLDVDLSTGDVESRAIPREWVELYTGQKGLGSRILLVGFVNQSKPGWHA